MEKDVQETTICPADPANFLEELLLKIFSHLRIDDLCRAGGACSRWHSITRCKSLWKTVDCHHLKLTSEQIGKLISILPDHTIHLRIRSFSSEPQLPIFLTLRERCPELQTLLLESIVMMTNDMKEIEARQLPINVKVISLRRCVLTPTGFFCNYARKRRSRERYPQIQVLDCSRCLFFTDSNLSVFSNLGPSFLHELYLSGCNVSDEGLDRLADAIPELRVLDLENTRVGGQAFEKVGSFEVLEELFLAGTLVTDLELSTFDSRCFPSLNIICLRETDTSLECQRSLLTALPTLQYVNGFSRSDVLSGTIPNDLVDLPPCDHFLRDKGFPRKI